MRRLGLDRVWWLVSPGNPLKDTSALPALAARIAAAKKIARDRRIVVTGLEAAIGARFTYQTILYLKARCPGVHFVWIMGADNLAISSAGNIGTHRRQRADRDHRPAGLDALVAAFARGARARPLPL